MNQAIRAKRRFILLMLLPATTVLAGLTIFPFVASVAMSVTNYSLVTPDDIRFIGLSNYVDLLWSPDFWSALKITGQFTILAVGIEMILGVGIALLLHHETRGVSTLRAIYLIPMAVTPVAAVFTFRMMFNPTLGVFNYFLTSLGFAPVDWLGTPGMALISLLIVDAWHWTPFIVLIAIGGLAAIDEEPLEAAKMDGAGPIALVFHHILPMLLPYLSVALVFRVIDAFKAFDSFFVLTGGGPGVSTRTLNLLAYKHGLEFLSMGYAATIAIIMLIMTIVVAQTFLRRMNLFKPKASL